VAVHAQTISGGGWSTAAAGDLILGFDDSTSEPSSGDLLVDLGPATDFYSTTNGGSLTPGTTYTVSAYTSSDLTTVYGSTEAGNGNVGWTVFGGNGRDGGPGSTVINTLWLSTPGASALQRKTNGNQSTPSGNIDNYVASLLNAPNTGLASSAATQDSGYSTVVQGTGTFGFLTSSSEASTAATDSLTLYLLLPTSSGTSPGTDLGRFTLSSSSLTFTPYQAIPEPSTYAAILGALAIGFALCRRRTAASALV
jgi:hypothetical protein